MNTAFDLNIDKVLPDWDITTAIREFIANAIDESVLSGTAFPTISFQDDTWIIKDYGRGLKQEHFVINENPEKKTNSKIIGKFGYGIKDAAAVLTCHNVDFSIHSQHLSASFHLLDKNGTNIKALHAVFSEPKISIGTEIHLNIEKQFIDKAKDYFLFFTPIKILQETKYGQVLDIAPGQTIPIYINGMKVATKESNKLAFGYNITNLDKTIREKLNRERMDLDWGIYSSQVSNILKHSKNNEFIINTLRKRYNEGYRDGEVGLKDVRAVFMENNEVVQIDPRKLTSTMIAEMEEKGIAYQIMTQQDAVITKELQNDGVSIKDDVWVNNLIDSQIVSHIFPIDESLLTKEELDVFNTYIIICRVLGYKLIRPIINKNNSEWSGLNHGSKIYVTRNQLANKAHFLGTYLHEMIHYKTKHLDVTREFELSLTDLIGFLADKLV